MNVFRTWLIIAAAMLVMWQNSSFASEKINITIGSWSFEQRSAHNLNFDILLTESGVGLQATADKLTLAEPIGQLNKVSLICTDFRLLSEQYSCKRGRLAFKHAELGSQQLELSVTAKPEIDNYIVKVDGLKLAGSEVSFTAKLANKNWHVLLESPQATLANLRNFLSPYLSKETTEQLSKWSYDADLAISAELQGIEKQINLAKIKLDASALGMSDSEGQYVAEDTDINIELDLAGKDKNWQWQTAINVSAGQAYGDPIFLDFTETPVSIQANGIWQQETSKLLVEHATVKQKNIAELEVDYLGDFSKPETMNISLKHTELNKLYPIWLQPFAVDTAAANLELAGNVAIKLSLDIDDYQFEVDLEDVFIDDEANRFGLYGLNGTFAWTNRTKALPLELKWQGGYVYAIPIGESKVVAETKSSQLDLLQTWVLPVLDGELHLNQFSLHRDDSDKTKWSFDGLLTPISMESLSSALQWPTLHGKLSGVIPKVSYDDQTIKIDGALLMKVFGGTTVLRDLQLDKAFGTLPQLYANVDIKNLDLETLTKTFDFGKITGKLDGQLNQLRLSNWRPVAFDARFYTPEGDKSRRRINQKAVDNLSKLGGAGGILQRSFLRFFKDFSYQRLGLSCQLNNDVCEMSGVSEAEQGYYIVKGGGLPPRINVVGYTRRVGWTDLIERLKSVSQSSGPVVQ